MIIATVDKEGELTKILSSTDYQYILKEFESMVEWYEEHGMMLVKEMNNAYSKVYEFATVSNGWEFALMLADGYVQTNTIKIR